MSEALATLPGMENAGQNGPIYGSFGQGPTESETRQAIAEIEADIPLTGVRRTIKQLAISLAISIDRGNTKGRAVANEAAQLFAMMQQLDPAADADAAPDDSHLTPETRRLIDAFNAPAQFDAPAEGDAPEL
jgi:hypothetical protein